jgi:UDP-N-acetylglucosamine 4,6-dehydratase
MLEGQSILITVLPTRADLARERYCEQAGGQPVAEGFAYNSGTNPDFLTVEQIRTLIREQLDPGFAP